MTQITKLTKEQEADMQQAYRDGLAVGRNCAPLDREAATKAIGDLYEKMNEPRPVGLFFSSPAMVVLAYAVLSKTKLSSQLGSQLGSQLSSQLGSQLGSQLYSQLYSQLGSQLGSQLYSQLYSQLCSQLDSRWGGQHWHASEVFYDFARRIGAKYTNDQNALLDMWIAQSKACHWWWPYKGLFLASERHTELHTNDQGQLHNESGMAVKYSDGWGVWALNGVRCEEKHVMTPAERYDIADAMKEENVEIRRELIRKVGVERMLAKLPHRSLDKMGDYELLSVDFPGLVSDARYLKMLNPSIGVWHMEGVERVCKTVQEAINWRAGVFGEIEWKPAQLT